MADLFLLLFVSCFVAIIIGIIKPEIVIRWGATEKRNRKNVLKYFGIGLIVFFILFGVSTSNTASGIKVQTAEEKTANDKVLADKAAAAKVVADKAAADKVAYLAQFSWYNSEFGVKIDSANRDEFGFVTIKGRAMPFKKDYSYVQITCGIYSNDGTKTGTALANMTNLAKGTTWQFEAIGTSSSSGNFIYKIEEVSGI